MNVQELIQTIKAEKLYEYYCFQIGPPHDRNNIGTFMGGGVHEGIYRDKNEEWCMYFQDDRGGVDIDPQKYTESEACEQLLASLRRKKAIKLEYREKKIDYTIKNPDRWWTEPKKRWKFW